MPDIPTHSSPQQTAESLINQKRPVNFIHGDFLLMKGKKMFKSILVQHRGSIALATLLSVCGALSGLLMLKFITNQLDAISASEPVTLAAFGLFFVSVSAVLLFGLGSRYLLAKLSAHVVYLFRETLAKRILATPYVDMERMGGHRILAAMKTDAAKLSDGLLVMPSAIYNLVTVLLCVTYMVYTSWQLSLIVLTLIVVIFLLARLVIRYVLKHLMQLRAFEDDLFQGMKTLVDGVKELSTDKRRRRFIFDEVLEPSFCDIRDHSVKVSLVFTMLNSMTSTLVFFVIGVVVFGTGFYFTELPTNIVVSFVLVILYMLNPLESVMNALNQMGHFAASYKTIESLPLANVESYEERVAVNPSFNQNHDWQTLEFNQVAFQYSGGKEDDYKFQLYPVDLKLKRGETVFLTGGNGSGKSTFAKLCVGLYQADSGKIQLDNDIIGQTIEQTDYQQLFSTIFSDFHLFEHVLNPEGELATDKEIAEYLQLLELGVRVKSDSGRLSTLSLSQGQRKRLALMMSYIENSPICLYDEWAADQDPRYREIFYTDIIPALKAQNKLVIVITHDDRYFHLADQLLQFEQGRLVKNIRPKNGNNEGFSKNLETPSAATAG